MRYASKIGIWLAVFLVVLAVRFPYEPVFLRLITKVQETTQAQISWDEVSASIFGAKLKGLRVSMPSGFAFSADQAEITPSLKGLKITCTQTAKDGNASALLTKNSVDFKSEKLEMETGSQDLGTIIMAGNLTYALSDASVKGEARFVIPDLSGLLPVSLKNVEIGSAISTDSSAGNKDNQTIVNALTLYGQGLDGDGTLNLTYPKDGGSPNLSGELHVNAAGAGSQTIKLGGTWAQPQWNLAGAN